MWLGVVIVLAMLLPLLFSGTRTIGENVGDNPLVLAVRTDRSSPAEESLAADLTLIVFTDYRCPACRSAHPGMKRAVARDGKVRIVYKDWPVFGPISERAAEVAIASDFQGIYPRVHDRLMTGAADNDALLQTAVEHSGGNWPVLQCDLVEHKSRIAAQLSQNKLQAFQLGLGGTPGYLIGPILVRGALEEKEFVQAFKQARDAKKLHRRVREHRRRSVNAVTACSDRKCRHWPRMPTMPPLMGAASRYEDIG